MKRFKNYINCMLVVAFMLGIFLPPSIVRAQESDIDDDITESIIMDEDYDFVSSEHLFESTDISGTSAFSIDDLFDERPTMRRGHQLTPTLTDIEVSHEGGYIIFNSILADENGTINLDAYGRLYQLESGGIILADMISQSESIHVVQFRIDRDPSSLLIVLQRTDTEELIQFNPTIDSYIYEELSNHIENPLEGENLQEKIVDLISVANNLLEAPDDIEGTYELDLGMSEELDVDGSNDFIGIQPFRTHSAWRTLLERLNSNRTATLSSYNVNANFFRNNGWHHDHQLGASTPYTATVFSRANGTGRRLVQISLLDYFHGQSRLNNTHWQAHFQVEYRSGVIAELNTSTGVLTPIWLNWGHTYTNVDIAMDNLRLQNVFVNRTVSMVAESRASVVRAATVLIPHAQNISDVWSNLSNAVNQDNNTTRSFDNNFTQQSNRNGGRVIRGIYNTTGSNSLARRGQFLRVSGHIHIGNSATISHRRSIRFTVRANV